MSAIYENKVANKFNITRIYEKQGDYFAQCGYDFRKWWKTFIQCHYNLRKWWNKFVKEKKNLNSWETLFVGLCIFNSEIVKKYVTIQKHTKSPGIKKFFFPFDLIRFTQTNFQTKSATNQKGSWNWTPPPLQRPLLPPPPSCKWL